MDSGYWTRACIMGSSSVRLRVRQAVGVSPCLELAQRLPGEWATRGTFVVSGIWSDQMGGVSMFGEDALAIRICRGWGIIFMGSQVSLLVSLRVPHRPAADPRWMKAFAAGFCVMAEPVAAISRGTVPPLMTGTRPATTSGELHRAFLLAAERLVTLTRTSNLGPGAHLLVADLVPNLTL